MMPSLTSNLAYFNFRARLFYAPSFHGPSVLWSFRASIFYGLSLWTLGRAQQTALKSGYHSHAISSSVSLFSWLQSFPASRSFPMSQRLASGGQSYWRFSFSITPSNEYSGLISSRIDWFDLLAVQGTLKDLLQHHSSKASIPWQSAFFVVQLSYPYMTTGKKP